MKLFPPPPPPSSVRSHFQKHLGHLRKADGNQAPMACPYLENIKVIYSHQRCWQLDAQLQSGLWDCSLLQALPRSFKLQVLCSFLRFFTSPRPWSSKKRKQNPAFWEVWFLLLNCLDDFWQAAYPACTPVFCFSPESSRELPASP